MGDLSYFIRRRSQLIKTHPIISPLLKRYPSPEHSHGLNKIVVIHFLKQLASALHFLHDKTLVHRDIKPQNLLLCPPIHTKALFDEGGYAGLWELPILKIADFGFARFLPATAMAETLCGSPLYMAPEILRYEKYNAKADLWLVGAVLFEMAVGKPPFKAENHIELLKNIEKAHDRIKFPSAAQVPDALKALIRSLLRYVPVERVSFSEFFSNHLIVDELYGDGSRLDTSDVDENLFISEYIPPTKGLHSMVELPINQDTILAGPEKGGTFNRTEGHAYDRDEHIKEIITQSSPGPETMLCTLQIKACDEGSELGPRGSDVTSKEDSSLDKEYVVVEKRVVEVNAIADELANAGSGAVAIKPRRTDSGLSGSGESSRSPTHSKTNNRRSLHSHSPAGHRRLSGTHLATISISPTNALSKAIGLASNRLFGQQPNPRPSLGQHTELLPAVAALPNWNAEFSNNLLLKGAAHSFADSLPQVDEEEPDLDADSKTLRTLKSLATKAHAISLFAEVKFSQLIPLPPSLEDIVQQDAHHVDRLPPSMVKIIGEEGVVLYVKTLSLLAKGMVVASEWWRTLHETTQAADALVESSSPTTAQINELVQWMRKRFNECLEKAEFIKLRLEDAISAIQHQIEDTDADQSPASHSYILEKKPVAEKLIFERALEMSRNAAINELVKEDLKGCELAYSTAIWMLEALLDEPDLLDQEGIDPLDKLTIEKFVMSIGNRLSILKRKMEM